MKIALCLFRYFPYGGLQRDFMSILTELLSRGHDISVFCHSWEGPHDNRFQLTCIPCHGSNHHKAQQFDIAFKKIRSEQSFDVVLGFNRMSSLDFYYGADTCFAVKAFKKPWLVRLLPRYRTFLALEQTVFSPQSTTRIFSLNDVVMQQYQTIYQTPSNRFINIDPWVPAPAQPLTKIAARQSLNLISDKKWVLLFVGTFLQVKGLDRVLQALKSLPNAYQEACELWVIGSKDQTKFEKLSKNLNLSATVRFLGNQENVHTYMQAADLLIHPARQELGGLVLIEAMYNNLPVLTTSNCGFAKHVKGSQLGWVIEGENFSQKQFDTALLDIVSEHAVLSANATAYAKNYLEQHDFATTPSKVANTLEQFKKFNQQ